MVIDSSAIVAILRDEPEKTALGLAIMAAPVRLMSTATAVETGMVALGRRGEHALAELRALIGALDIEMATFTNEHAQLAVDAFRRFGKGRHPAGLNFGDCFSYALAKATGEPLLFKGDDFSQTDIKRAV
jgi:ribonuclease VapC